MLAWCSETCFPLPAQVPFPSSPKRGAHLHASRTLTLVLFEDRLCERAFNSETTKHPNRNGPHHVCQWKRCHATTSPDHSSRHMNDVLNIVHCALHVRQLGKEMLHPLRKHASALQGGPGKSSSLVCGQSLESEIGSSSVK